MTEKGYAKLANFDDYHTRSNNVINISCSTLDTDFLYDIGLSSSVDEDGVVRDKKIKFDKDVNTILFGDIRKETFSSISSCKYGCSEGNFLDGTICPVCDTEVTSGNSTDFNFKRFIILPNNLKFIHPTFMQILIRFIKLPSNAATIRDPKTNKDRALSILDWLFDRTLDIKTIFPELNNGYTWVIENFDYVIKYFIKHPSNRKHALSLLKLYKKYKPILLIDKFPIPTENLHLFIQNDENGGRISHDSTAPYLRKVYSDLRDIVKSLELGRKLTDYNLDKKYLAIYDAYLKYTYGLITTKLTGKLGLLRQSVISGRMHNTARCVITPITEVHYLDEFIVPWEVLVVSLKATILSHLMTYYNYAMKEAEIKHRIAIYNTEDKDIENILNSIIRQYIEYGYKGIPTIANRNPSIKHLNLQLVFTVGFSKDKTIQIPLAITPSFNADFDGDHLSVVFIKEVDYVPFLTNIHPSAGIPMKDFPEISDWVRNPTTLVINANNWLNKNNPTMKDHE